MEASYLWRTELRRCELPFGKKVQGEGTLSSAFLELLSEQGALDASLISSSELLMRRSPASDARSAIFPSASQEFSVLRIGSKQRNPPSRRASGGLAVSLGPSGHFR